MKTKSTRLLWPDVARSLAIYLVIFIHTAPALPSHIPDHLPSYFIYALKSVSVPLFVMLSGSFLLGKKESYTDFFTKRCLRVLIPWVLWTFIYMVYFYLLEGKNLISLHDWVSYFRLTFLTQFWFMPMLFTLYLLTPLLQIFFSSARKNDILYALLLWFFFISFVPFVEKISGFDFLGEANIFLQYLGYFVLGYFLNSAVSEKKHVRLLLGLFFASLMATVVGTLFFWLRGGGSTDGYFYSFMSPTSVCAAGSLFLLLKYAFPKGKKVLPGYIEKIIRISGKASLGIYFIHFMLFSLLTTFFPVIYEALLSVYSLFAAFFISGIVFLASFVSIAIIRRIPLLRYLSP